MNFPVLEFNVREGVHNFYKDADSLRKINAIANIGYLREVQVVDSNGVAHRTEVNVESAGVTGRLLERCGLWFRKRQVEYVPNGVVFDLAGFQALLLTTLRVTERWDENLDFEESAARINAAKSIQAVIETFAFPTGELN